MNPPYGLLYLTVCTIDVCEAFQSRNCISNNGGNEGLMSELFHIREIQKCMAAQLPCQYEFFHIFISRGIWNCNQTNHLGLLNIGAFWFLWIITDVKNQCITNWHTLTFVNMTHCPKEVLLKQVIIGFKNATSLEIGFFHVTLTLACLCTY